MRQYDNASNLLMKIYNILTTKEKFKDNYELEICLTNLNILSFLQGNANSLYFKYKINEK